VQCSSSYQILSMMIGSFRRVKYARNTQLDAIVYNGPFDEIVLLLGTLKHGVMNTMGSWSMSKF
jgi:hypothetical protein